MENTERFLHLALFQGAVRKGKLRVVPTQELLDKMAQPDPTLVRAFVHNDIACVVIKKPLFFTFSPSPSLLPSCAGVHGVQEAPFPLTPTPPLCRYAQRSRSLASSCSAVVSPRTRRMQPPGGTYSTKSLHWMMRWHMTVCRADGA